MIDISFEPELAQELLHETAMIVENAAQFALDYMSCAASVNVLLTDNEGIRQINADFRNIDSVTDVLSFPAADGSEFDISDGYLGDIAISVPRALEQAELYGHSVKRELSFLTVHGILHIMGYDHMTSDEESEMFSLQNEILSHMGIID